MAAPAARLLLYCSGCGARPVDNNPLQLKACERCKAALYCNADCQRRVYAAAYKAPCRARVEGRISASLTTGPGDIRDVECLPEDPRLRLDTSHASPVLALCGLPVRLFVVSRFTPINNQLARISWRLRPAAWRRQSGSPESARCSCFAATAFP